MIRLSVTDIDSYLYWRDNDDMELEALLSRLRREEPPTMQMQAGRAFHQLLEHAEPGEIPSAIVDGFEFVFELNQEIPLPTIRELKAEKVFDTPSGTVTLVGVVDGLVGNGVRDYKLTERFDAERYADSYQWRSYLTMFGATRFVYDVFQCRYDGERIIVYEYHRMVLHAYNGMERDVLRAVAGLAEIVAKHAPEKITKAA